MRPFLLACFALLAVGCTSSSEARRKEVRRQAGHDQRLKRVAALPEQMPTGVAVSAKGRVFVCFPRWEDPVRYTVAEVKDGVAVPYPGEAMNRGATPDQLVSVQSVVVDPQDRLWAEGGYGAGEPRAGHVSCFDEEVAP